MAGILKLANGSYRVSWYDSAGVRQRRALKTKKAAQELYDALCAQRMLEQTGLSSALGGQ